jgi:23S rRNA (guanosine2251-2'-O)-methyltransferase
MNFLYIEGRRSVEEAIKSNANINYIMVADGLHLGSIISLAKEHNIRIKTVSKTKMDYTSKTKKHQGVIAVVSGFEYADTDEILKISENKNEKPFLIILDQISDPHNLGAIIRSAECFASHGVLIPKNRSAAVNETVYRSSAGAVSHIPIAQVTNISTEIDRLKKLGLWIVCADMDGEDIDAFDFDMPLALVFGAEGSGVSRLVKEKCDFIVKIPIKGEVASLNVSVAAGIIMHKISRVRN